MHRREDVPVIRVRTVDGRETLLAIPDGQTPEEQIKALLELAIGTVTRQGVTVEQPVWWEDEDGGYVRADTVTRIWPDTSSRRIDYDPAELGFTDAAIE